MNYHIHIGVLSGDWQLLDQYEEQFIRSNIPNIDSEMLSTSSQLKWIARSGRRHGKHWISAAANISKYSIVFNSPEGNKRNRSCRDIVLECCFESIQPPIHKRRSGVATGW